MAVYRTYVSIPHSSYGEWKSNTLGNSYDVDGIPAVQPFQCWDYTAEFWWNLGFPQNYPLTGGEDAKGVWTQRFNNLSHDGEQFFDLITDKTQIQVGDVIVFGQNLPYLTSAGHIAFADENYNGTNTIACLGQNQEGQDFIAVNNILLTSFLGAFRPRMWHISPTPVLRNRSHFKWVLYARKIREK